MNLEVFASIFANAAPPQKAVFILLIAALAAALTGMIIGLLRRPLSLAWRRRMADLRTAGPLLGLLVVGLNGLHMARTILRSPIIPTLKDLAPGILEVSALLSLGGLVGLSAAIACLLLNASD